MRWKNRFEFSPTQNKYIIKGALADNTLPKTAIGYTRVSTEDQMENGDGIASQKTAIQRYADLHKIRIVGWFKDEAISWTIDNRPWMNEAIDFLKLQNQYGIVISYFISTELSRISRNSSMEKTYALESRIEKTKAKILTIDQAPDIKQTSNVELSNDMKRMMAKYEAKIGSERTLNGLRNVIVQGKRPFSLPPMWYKKDTTTWILVKDEPTASHIKQGLEMFLSGELKTKKDLYLFLDEKRVGSNSNNYKWKLHPSIVDTLLEPFRLLFYCSELVYPKRWIFEPIKWLHEPLLEKDFVERLLQYVQQRKKTYMRQEKNTTVHPDLYLRWITYCEICWHKLTWALCKGKMGVRYPYYRCLNKLCTERRQSYIMAHKLESCVASYLKENNINPKIMPLINKIFSKAREHRDTNKSDINKRRQDDITSLVKEMAKVENAIVNAGSDELRVNFEGKRKELNLKKMELQKVIDEDAINPDDFNRLLEKSRLLFLSPENILTEPNMELRQLLLGVQTGDHILWGWGEKKVWTPQNAILTLTKKITQGDFVSTLDNGARSPDLFLNLKILYKTLWQLQYKLEFIQTHFDVSKYLAMF